MAEKEPSPVAESPVGDDKQPEIQSTEHDEALPAALPSGWKYRSFKFGKWRTPHYASPRVQLVMVSFVCFLCPGMFNALSGLGGGGRIDPTLADQMNIALNSTFAVFAFFGGTFVNRLGVKITLAFGGVGYCIYALSLLASVKADVFGFNIFAGALLGVCAGLLWTAQGTIMMSYPHEEYKGRYFAAFWGIFNMGAVVGSLVPLGENIHSSGNVSVGIGTYIPFCILMFMGACLALLLCNAKDVIRSDGTRVVLMKNPSWQSEFIGLWETIQFEPYVILLFPMFWSSNWFYTYQQNSVNGIHFTTRTKALNSLLYYFAQIIGALVIGKLLDLEQFKRSTRAKANLVGLFVLTMVVWGGGFAYQKTYERGQTIEATDWSTPGYVGPMFLYMFYGLYDAIWQASVYWYMGALSNSGRRTANYVGFYKGIQSAGAAVMNAIDSKKVSYMAEFATNWGLLGFSVICAAPVIFMKIKDTVELEADLKNTDETIEDVLPTAKLQHQGEA
jgi:hypothetical protein